MTIRKQGYKRSTHMQEIKNQAKTVDEKEVSTSEVDKEADESSSSNTKNQSETTSKEPL